MVLAIAEQSTPCNEGSVLIESSQSRPVAFQLIRVLRVQSPPPNGFSQIGHGAGRDHRIGEKRNGVHLCSSHAACNTRWRSKGNRARPYIIRLINLSRLTWPSTTPFEQTVNYTL